MTYPATPCRFVQTTGEKRYSQSAWWGEEGSCVGRHHRQTVDWPNFGIDSSWMPSVCDECGAEWDHTPYSADGRIEAHDPNGLFRSAASWSEYNTEDGKLHPGDMYFADYKHGEGGECRFDRWTNCPGQHLQVVLPNGMSWDIDSRANNCSLPDDTTHRCWVRTGEPPNVSAGKNGPTCSAGAGSILCGDYHGFLQSGVLTAG